MNLDSRAAQDADAIYLGNLNTVEFDLELPAVGNLGSKITWKTSDPRFLSETGQVKRPTFGLGDRDVVLEGTFDDGTKTFVRTWTVHILEARNTIRVRKVLVPEQTCFISTTISLPSALPVETEEGDIVMQDVLWDGGALRMYEKVGPQEEHGIIAGTDAKVTLQIHAVERILREPVPEPRLQAVPVCDVRLLEGTPFYDAMQRMKAFLLRTDADQLLYSFRQAAGLDTQGAIPMIGWDSPECQLRGHTTGHFLSALAFAYGATGDERLKEKAEYLVQALADCQQAFSEKEGFHPGFLSAYSEEQFDLLEQYVRYPQIWAPYYTLHKILAGLLDVHEQTGNTAALDVAVKLGLWVHERLRRLDPMQLKRMWSLYIAGEYGGMNEVLARLYQLTGDQSYLATARLFDNDKLLIPCSNGIDALSGMHANQHIPQIIGALRLYEACGDPRYYMAAKNFWQAVTGHHIYAIGGVGEKEMFRCADWIYRTLSDSTAESCASYNMLKLTKDLFLREADPAYMDYYERTLFNHILAAGEKSELGRTTYFMPLKGGFRKQFFDENSCCHGTGLESPFRFGEMICSRAEGVVQVEQWIDSELRPEGIRICTNWLEDSLQMTIRFEKDFTGVLKVRTPDGEGPYQTLQGLFRAGDKAVVKRPLQLLYEASPDAKDKGVLRYGPYILAVISEETEPVVIDMAALHKTEGGLEWSDDHYTLIPLAAVNDEKYHIYLQVKGA